ncbi:GerMN domain-containing protein [Agromyces humatus]|uniref:LpqB family beta-propeller domain-containing protein n=1 Tax=Agromyces humatus TaxID=279573 RepID=A0ABN2K6J3_9MICO|nr:GerMN domain-containing protein [Agromyces humatus]
MRRRRAAATSLALILVAMLTACVSLPSSGPVTAGDPEPVEESLELDTFARGPQTDATQEQIVQGFIEAAASPRGRYQVAREYLTPAFAEVWQPDERATIDVLADRAFEQTSETTMVVDVTPTASLTSNGQYDLPESSAEVQLPYRLEQVDGQWRIAEAPQGLLVDELTFEEVFLPQALYFYDTEYRYLVPDLRWFAGRDSVQTSIVRGLLAGPAEWLEPGVVSAFPEGVQLDPNSVPVSSRAASVGLSGASFDDLVSVQRMQAQLDASLVGSVRNVDDVVLSLDGAEQNVPALSPQPEVNPRVDPRPVVFDGTSFGHLSSSGESIEQISGISPQVEGLAPDGASVGPGAEAVAVRSAGGVAIVRADEDAAPLDPRPGLVVPDIDPQGVVWSVPSDAPGELVAFLPDGTELQILVPWSGSSIAAIEVSRDGTRMIALLGDGARTQFVAASIERDGDGFPTQLGPVALRLSSVAGTPLDVAWLDARRVASITALPGGETRVVIQVVGGFAEVIQGPADGISVVGGNGERDLRVLTSAGALDARSGVGWQVRATGIRFTATQQPD